MPRLGLQATTSGFIFKVPATTEAFPFIAPTITEIGRRSALKVQLRAFERVVKSISVKSKCLSVSIAKPRRVLILK